jgi:hypothetical protein
MRYSNKLCILYFQDHIDLYLLMSKQWSSCLTSSFCNKHVAWWEGTKKHIHCPLHHQCMAGSFFSFSSQVLKVRVFSVLYSHIKTKCVFSCSNSVDRKNHHLFFCILRG